MGKEIAPTTVGDDLARIMGDTVPEVEDSEQAQRAIVERILAAETAEDVWQDSASTATRDLLGVPLEVRDVKLMASNIEGATGTYALLDAVRLDTGEVILVNSGSPTIMATVVRRKQLGSLPMQCVVVEVGQAKPGQSAPLGLKPHGADLKAFEARKQVKKAA
jgi:hypothetical protein